VICKRVQSTKLAENEVKELNNSYSVSVLVSVARKVKLYSIRKKKVNYFKFKN
jgi:hypothetical protein